MQRLCTPERCLKVNAPRSETLRFVCKASWDDGSSLIMERRPGSPVFFQYPGSSREPDSLLR